MHRLVEPLRAAPLPTKAHVAVAATVGACAVATGAGMVFGEGLVRAILGTL